jgi:stage III sporulation protein AE
MEIIKIMALAVIAVLICVYLKNIGSPFHLYISLSVCVLIMLMVVLKLSSVIESISKFTDYLKYSGEYADILLKTVIITYVTSFTSDICKDSGYNSIANQVELFGKITIIILSIPVIFELLDMTVIQSFGCENTKFETEYTEIKFTEINQKYNASKIKFNNSTENIFVLEFEILETASLEDEIDINAYDYSEIDAQLENTGIQNLTFKEIITQLINGEFLFWEYCKSIIQNRLSSLNTYKTTFVNILLLAVFSGIFNALASQGSRLGYDTSRIIIMINLVVILSKLFTNSLRVCSEAIESILSIYQALMPVFMTAVAVITGSVTYAAYYQVILIGISLVNMLFLSVAVPLIRADYCIAVVNGLSSPERFGKLVKFIEDGVKWTCRIIIIAFTGMGCVKGIMAPMSDSFKRKLFYKSAKIIPGLGDSLDVISSAVYGSGIIIKNGIGIGGIILIIMMIGAPLIHIAVNFLLLKLTSAMLQPMADKAFVQLIDDIAGIIGLLLLLVSVTGLLFIILTGLICVFTNSY